jgi:protease-4
MSKSNSIWKQADSFLAMTRKILVNGVTAIVLIALTFSFLGGIFASFGESGEVTVENKVLWFKPIGVVVDTEVVSSNNVSIEGLLNGGSSAEQYELQDLLDVLNAAATDDGLSAVYVNVSELGMYWASAFKIAEAVKNVKDSGKRVIAYAEGYGNNAYLISSQASEVLVNEYGAVEAFGFSRKREYYVDLYKNIKLNYNVFTAGDFKSGPEPYTRDSMSENDKIAWNAFAEPMWEKMTSMMESGRKLSKGTIQDYGDNAHVLFTENPEAAQVALNLGLVDKVVTREEIRNYMFEQFPNEEDDKYAFPDSISIYDYLDTIEADASKSSNKIAIVNIEGAIMTGEAAYGIAGSDTIVKNIQSATKDEDIKAMVLRVNSPGGDVWASELITNALEEFKNTGRPVVTSMGDVAASGGVWVTTNSDEIWAEEDTLTGSIGVYGIIPTMDGLYDWAGISVDGVSSTKAGEWDEREAMPDYVKNMIQSSIDNIYKKFVTKVAENRDMAYVDVLPIAGGRIWSGVKALELGLVDKIGDLEDALSSAANMAEIEGYSVKTYRKELDPIDIFLQEILENIDYQVKVDPNLKILLDTTSKYSKIISLEDENIMAYCFECDAIDNL